MLKERKELKVFREPLEQQVVPRVLKVQLVPKVLRVLLVQTAQCKVILVVKVLKDLKEHKGQLQ